LRPDPDQKSEEATASASPEPGPAALYLCGHDQGRPRGAQRATWPIWGPDLGAWCSGCSPGSCSAVLPSKYKSGPALGSGACRALACGGRGFIERGAVLEARSA
jgi:hypothetical protein